MPLRTMKWMPLCVILSLSSCSATLTDSYCSVYNPVVVESGDGKIAAKTSVKRRILANEQTYRTLCK